MQIHKLIHKIYTSDALYNAATMEAYVHPELELNWNSSKGLLRINKSELLELTQDVGKSYRTVEIDLHQTVCENNKAVVHYTMYASPVENETEWLKIGHFMVIWELKEEKLYRGHLITQTA